MFNFAGITHVIENPKGHKEGHNYSLVGSVPVSMMEGRKPTPSDVMGGRVQKDGLAYYDRKWESIEQVLNAAIENDVKLCTAEGCACRKLFTVMKGDTVEKAYLEAQRAVQQAGKGMRGMRGKVQR